MNCYAHQLALAAAGATAVMYSFGCIALHFYPDYMLQLWAPLIYVQQQNMPLLEISFLSYGYGLVQSFLYTYLYARIFAVFCARLLPEY